MTSTSFLARPASVFKSSYIEALREGFGAPWDEDGIAAVESDFEAYLASLDNDGQAPFHEFGRVSPSVPSNVFWLVDGGEFIGRVHIRARVDTHVLARFGGHVGYGVRPSKRRRGYGTRQFALALQICRGMGIGVVRVSCAEDNIGSRKIIEANGGLLLRRCEPEYYKNAPYLLYEIILI